VEIAPSHSLPSIWITKLQISPVLKPDRRRLALISICLEARLHDFSHQDTRCKYHPKCQQPIDIVVGYIQSVKNRKKPFVDTDSSNGVQKKRGQLLFVRLRPPNQRPRLLQTRALHDAKGINEYFELWVVFLKRKFC